MGSVEGEFSVLILFEKVGTNGEFSELSVIGFEGKFSVFILLEKVGTNSRFWELSIIRFEDKFILSWFTVESSCSFVILNFLCFSYQP